MTKPNILFILTDQMRGDCLSVTGHPLLRTPNLDVLASRGAVFTRAYSPCPSCIAARAALWTGLSPSSAGRIGYEDCVPWQYEDMLPELLRQGGYQTYCIGKTHFFPQRATLGFDWIEGYESWQDFGGYASDYLEWVAERTGGKLREQDAGLGCNSWKAAPSVLPEELHNNTWVATRGIEFLRRRDPSRPFFLNLSFVRPHPPLDPPQQWWDRWQGREIPPAPVGDWAHVNDVPMTDPEGWRGRISAEDFARARRAYYAQIEHIDFQIGRFLEAMARMVGEPTWIVFTSDHGEILFDHHLFRKTWAYEGSARVPLIIAPPTAQRPVVCDAPVVLQDLYSTMLGMAGLPVPPRNEGLSLLPAMQGDCGSIAATRPFVHGEHSPSYIEADSMQFVTDGRWKYIWYTVTGQEQLFDLANDPDELVELAAKGKHGQELERCRKALIAVLAKRPQDGLTDGKRLLAGKSLPAVRKLL